MCEIFSGRTRSVGCKACFFWNSNCQIKARGAPPQAKPAQFHAPSYSVEPVPVYLHQIFKQQQCVRSFLSWLVRVVARWAMLAGSSSVLSTAFSRTARCPQTRPLVEAMMLSTPSSLRLVPASTFLGVSSSTLSRLLSTRSVLAPTVSCSIRSS